MIKLHHNKKLQFLIAIIALAAAACSSAPKRAAFGAPILIQSAVPAREVIAAPEKFLNKNIVIEGAPATVCKVKGCWMMFNENGKQMRVTFQSYGFFVPTDSAGRRMRLEGTLEKIKISEQLARHYLEDEGKHDETNKIVGEQTELRFLATGVEVY
ncbi:MAG: DUF4920 domain-containing protein [Planctomycetota bacterium]